MKGLAAPLLLALAGCSSPAPSQPDAGASDTGLSGPVRTLTTRPLLGTSPRNLLLDPFVTADTSWGHFNGILLPVTSAGPQTHIPRRAYVSQAPAGVAVPVALVAAIASVAPAYTSFQIVAPFPGGSDPFDADVWVSAGDASDRPVSFDTVARSVTVALLPNDQPATTFPLAPTGAPPLLLAGRQWVSLALPSPAPLLQGGWFSITIHDPQVSLQIQAPEVTPTAVPGPRPPPVHAARTPHERGAPAAYVEITRRRP